MINTETRQALTSANALWRDMRIAYSAATGLQSLLLRDLLADAVRIHARLAEIIALSEDK